MDSHFASGFAYLFGEWPFAPLCLAIWMHADLCSPAAASQLSTKLVTFVLTLLTARFLSVEGYGVRACFCGRYCCAVTARLMQLLAQIAAVQFHLINSTILLLSREGFRRGCLRAEEVSCMLERAGIVPPQRILCQWPAGRAACRCKARSARAGHWPQSPSASQWAASSPCSPAGCSSAAAILHTLAQSSCRVSATLLCCTCNTLMLCRSWCSCASEPGLKHCLTQPCVSHTHQR